MRRRLESSNRACLRALSPLLLVGVGAGAAGPQADPQQDHAESRFFAIPLARAARDLAEEAQEHVLAQRWDGAIEDLQRLIENHDGDVLPSKWRPSADQPSDYPAHPGAAEWAEMRLRSLPEEARELYRQRYGALAQAALGAALGRGDRRALAEVARRWPITAAAERAWWILGDLELERGHADNAVAAWRRGVATHGAEPPGAAERFAAARAILEREGTRWRGGFPPAAGADHVPRSDGDTWSQPVDLQPLDGRSGFHFNVYPVLADDRVLVCSTLNLSCIDAYSGELIWESGRHPGWAQLRGPSLDQLFEGIAQDRLLVAPAVGGNVVVCALQIPFAREQNQEWQNISIIKPIPERRLYAYDLETGRELWSHAPQLSFDEKGSFAWIDTFGTFAERMLVGAPPVIAGSRVLVPCYQMQGRIDYHVACYELGTGELLWSTNLISGQRERNMFGRASEEFVASPLTVARDRVIAQTELGTVAALDLVTGRILWEALYRQIPLEKNQTYDASERHRVWRENAPLVVDDVVISTPTDSEDILALDLADGRVLWSQSEEFLRRSYSRSGSDLDAHDLLLGAEADTLYLGGRQVTVLQKPGGLDSHNGFVARWSRQLDNDRNRDRPRALLGPYELVVPTREERQVVDPSSGVTLHALSAPWDNAQAGNVALGKGVMFSLGRDRLTAFFDWETLISRQRARLAEAPADPAVVVATAEILARRGESLYEREAEAGRALDYLAEARSILQPLLEGGPLGARQRMGEAQHRILRIEARVRAAIPDAQGALQALSEALPLASTPFERRDTLFQREQLLRNRRLRERLDLWDELESTCADLSLPEDVLAEPPSWLLGEALIEPEELGNWQRADLSVGLWVLLARADAKARANETAGALADLHTALARHGDVPLGPNHTVRSVVCERIGRRLELDGAAEYAAFEARAEKLLGEALAANEERELARVAELYPHSHAAVRANAERLERAFQRDDAATIAAIAYGDTGAAQSAAVVTSALLRLGAVLERLGNRDFAAGLVASLARTVPTESSDLPAHGGKSFAELGRELPPPFPRPMPTFDQEISLTGNGLAGNYSFVGELPPLEVPAEGTPEVLHVWITRNALYAFSTAVPSQQVWTHDTSPLAVNADPSGPLLTCDIGADRIVLVGTANGRGIVRAVDREGRLAWTRDLGTGRPVSVDVDDGVAVVLSGQPLKRVLAFDAHVGTPLWELELPREIEWRPPLVAEGRVVLFSLRHGQPSSAIVADLFRGEVLRRLEVDRTEPDTSRQAWLRGERLMIPRFSSSRGETGVSVYALDREAEPVTVGFAEGEELHSVIQYEDQDFLVTVSNTTQTRARGGAIYAFDAELASLKTIVSLKQGDAPMGVAKSSRERLTQPFLFIYERGASGKNVPVQAIHLPFERRWVYLLPVPGDELYDGGMPMPAVSKDCVVFAYVMRSSSSSLPGEARLEFVDKNGGFRLNGRALPNDFSYHSRIQLRGLGDALFVSGQGHGVSRLEILEELR